MPRGTHIYIDGKSSVDQGDYFPQQSVGSRSLITDLDRLQNWWGVRQHLLHIDPCPRDENGQPMRLCSNGHYSPVRAFSKNTARPDGLDNYCKACRHEMYQKAKRDGVLNHVR